MKAVLLNLSSTPLKQQPCLAGLPLYLRAFLGAQRAGVEEIVIISKEYPTQLLEDRRVRVAWHWVPPEPTAGQPREWDALRRTLEQLKEEFVLLFAESIFEPKALTELQKAGLNGKVMRLAGAPGATEPWRRATLFLCSPKVSRHLLGVRGAEDLDAFLNRLREQNGLDRVESSARVWPRTTEPEQLRRVYRELTHFHLKRSDGIFAKFNKLVVAEPLIRFFLRTPATPNFVTALGLFFALGSAWAFAHGSYGWSLTGALLAYVSALMDHVDGMVARLKFLESDFGVWFESAVDVTSYLCIFGGLAVGLYRETGFIRHLAVGGLFFLGALASFATTSRQRNLASGDDPADYVNRIHSKLEERSSNIFHWFTRKCYFLTRRAVLPYFILLFCLLDLRLLLLGWVTLGAHLVWTLTLYNNRLFRGPKQAGAAGNHASSPTTAVIR